jgi:cation:H+ antiporter
LTLVAVGTSLPELATTLVAAFRRESGIALGNVIGSNLFNLLGVAGPVALIQPLAAPSSMRSHQLPALILMTILLPLLIYRRKIVSRVWGGALLIIYLAIMIWWVRSGV